MKFAILKDYRSGISEAALGVLANNVLTHTKESPNFTAIKTPLVDTELQTAVDRFILACQEASNGDKIKAAEKRAYKDEVVGTLGKVDAHVTLIAFGNEAILRSSGFNVKRIGLRTEKPLEAVSGLRAQTNTGSNVVILSYKAATSARAHIAEMSTDEKVWLTVGNSTTSTVTLSGIPTRQEVLLRVYAVGSGQRKSAPSEAVRVYLL